MARQLNKWERESFKEFNEKLKQSFKFKKIKVMAISKEMIQESKINVIRSLEYHLDATEKEINQFVKRIEDENPENWTCGFGDELVPDFEKMREENLENEPF